VYPLFLSVYKYSSYTDKNNEDTDDLLLIRLLAFFVNNIKQDQAESAKEEDH